MICVIKGEIELLSEIWSVEYKIDRDIAKILELSSYIKFQNNSYDWDTFLDMRNKKLTM